MRATFVSVPAEKGGLNLRQLAQVLADAGVNIEAFSVDKAGARFLTEEPGKAVQNLQRHGYEPTTVEVHAVDLANRPGQLLRLAETMRSAGVEIDSAFGIAAPASARIFFRSSDTDRAEAALLESGFMDQGPEA